MPDSAVKTPPAFARLTEQAMRAMADKHPWEGSSDEVSNLAVTVIESAIPRGKALWRLLYDNPELGEFIGGPGAVAMTLEEVVRDSFHDALWWPVWRWVQAVEAADKLIPIDAGAPMTERAESKVRDLCQELEDSLANAKAAANAKRVEEVAAPDDHCDGSPCTCTNGIGCVNVPYEQW